MAGQHIIQGPQSARNGSTQQHTTGSVGGLDSQDIRHPRAPSSDMSTQQAIRGVQIPQTDSNSREAAFAAEGRGSSAPHPRTSGLRTGYSGQEQTAAAKGLPPPQLPMTQALITSLTSSSPLKDFMSPPSLPFVDGDQFRLAIAITTVVSLAPRRGAFPLCSEDMNRYLRELVRAYNNEVPAQHPRMAIGIHGDQDQWSIKRYVSASLPSSFLPCSVGLSSPFLSVLEDPSSSRSPWQRHIEALWAFLDRHYVIKGDSDFDTDIVVSSQDREITIPYIKRVSQAVVHFEPFVMGKAVDQIRSKRPIKRNWRDNPRLGVANLGRPRSIAAIEAALPNQLVCNPTAVLNLIQAPNSNGEPYYWTILRTDSDVQIQFRKPQGCATADDAITWMEFVVSFVQGALACPSAQLLQQIPLSREGLRYFMYGKESMLGRYRFGARHNPNAWLRQQGGEAGHSNQ